MKRYNVEADYHVTGYGTHTIEDPQGEWVKWEDAEKLQDETYKVGYFTGENTKKVRAADHQTEGQGLGAKGLKCNCEEMYDTGYIGSWFCEAHGYKKR